MVVVGISEEERERDGLVKVDREGEEREKRREEGATAMQRHCPGKPAKWMEV